MVRGPWKERLLFMTIPDLCEFGSRSRPCRQPAVATLVMPPNAPKRERRCCADHARRFEEIGETVRRDAIRAAHSHRGSDPTKLTILVSADELDGGYIAEVDELPGCLTQGESIEETLTNLGEAIRGVLDSRVANSQQQAEE